MLPSLHGITLRLELDTFVRNWQRQAMVGKNALPRVSRIAFFTCKDDQLVHAIAGAIREHASQKPSGPLSDAQMALHAWSRLLIDVPNGGFTQFFFNQRGDRGIGPLRELLASLDLSKLVILLEQAAEVFDKHRDRFAVENPWEGLFGSIKEFDKLDRAFMNAGVVKANAALDEWMRSHIRELVVGDDGKPIDPSFTGKVEARHPNGQVAEMLDVKNGKANGACKEFFDDGTVRQVIFYKAGKITGDYWPNGQLKKRESKRAGQKLLEWYFPSGKLQKRIALDKSGAHAEPIRLFHENGQLAEEVVMQGGKKRGRWLKFFEDGSPQLQAEFTEDRDPVIHNAWDLDRRQVVKDGAGVFDDDGRRIDPQYALFFKSQWRSVSDLSEGVRHGKTTTYHAGVLWSVAQYVRGKQEGESTSYWDNGRVRRVIQYERGKEMQSRSFAKFDRPVPAVLLKVEANEELYSAWRHIPVDEYPMAENLDEIRRLLRVPQFLLEVHERNLAGQLKSDYEDCGTFDDGIAYFLHVDASGRVVDARANGSGVYSGGNWGTYVPLLKELRFAPGRIRGRAVECRVLACVDHTFVEGPVTLQPQRPAAKAGSPGSTPP